MPDDITPQNNQQDPNNPNLNSGPAIPPPPHMGVNFTAQSNDQAMVNGMPSLNVAPPVPGPNPTEQVASPVAPTASYVPEASPAVSQNAEQAQVTPSPPAPAQDIDHSAIPSFDSIPEPPKNYLDKAKELETPVEIPAPVAAPVIPSPGEPTPFVAEPAVSPETLAPNPPMAPVSPTETYPETSIMPPDPMAEAPITPNIPVPETPNPVISSPVEPTPYVAEPVVSPEIAPNQVMAPAASEVPAASAAPVNQPLVPPMPAPSAPAASQSRPVNQIQFEQVVAEDVHEGVSLEQDFYPTNNVLNSRKVDTPTPVEPVEDVAKLEAMQEVETFKEAPTPVAPSPIEKTPLVAEDPRTIEPLNPAEYIEPAKPVEPIAKVEAAPIELKVEEELKITPRPLEAVQTPEPKQVEEVNPIEIKPAATAPLEVKPVESGVINTDPLADLAGHIPANPPEEEIKVPSAEEILANPDVLKEDYQAAKTPLVEVAEEGKEMKEVPKSTKKKKKSKVILFVLLGILTVFLGMIGVGVLMLASKSDPSSNALFTALGIESPSLMTFVFLVSSVVLGIFSFVAFTMGVIYLFKFLKTSKEHKSFKKKRLLAMVLSFFLTILFVFGLVFSSMNLNKYKIGPIQELEVILSNPVDTIGLTTPVEIDFEVANLPIDPNSVEIIGYIWEFGDGGRATGEQVKHTFTKKPADGLYEVSLTIQYKESGNESVQTETYTKTVSIENESVAAVFSMDPEEGRVPLEVVFDASESFDPDGEIVMYEWDFNGDGDYEGEGELTTYTYEEAGEFTVSLRLTDTNGAQTTSEQTVVAKGEDIISFDLELDPDDEILSPELAYQFDASGSTSDEGKIIKYEWTFGDGSSGEGQKFSHAYAEEGLYTVIATLTDEAENTRSFETEVKVSKSSSGLFARIQTVPEANQTDKSLLGTAPFKVNFSGGNSSGGDIVDYAWDFNSDGEIDANGKTIDHTFDKAGTYNVFLTIKSADDKEAREAFVVKVESAGLQAKINATPATGIAPTNVTFDASDSSKPDDVEIVSYQWDFGDGTPINKSGARVTHKYTKIGTFKPSLLIIDTEENFSKVETVIHINSTPLEACYTMTRKIGPAPLFVEFNPTCSTGAIDSYTWDFAGLGASDKIKPDFSFDVPGTYEIKLEVSDRDNNIAEFSDTVIVE